MSRRLYVLTFVCCFFAPQLVWAHALKAHCRVFADKVTVEAFFDDDTPSAQALVKVYDADKKMVAEGKTDAKGFWSFPRPPRGEYQVLVDGGAGHRATEKLHILKDAPGKQNTSAADSSTQETEVEYRPEANSYRWLKVAIGLIGIAALSIGYLVARRLGPRRPAADSTQFLD
jgi:hypothetical protein